MKQYTAIQNPRGVWTFTWAPLPGSFYEVWLDGVLLNTTAAGIGTYTTTPGAATDTPPPVEIHDTIDGLAQSNEYASRAIMQWRGLSGSTGYRVDRSVDGGWQPVSTTTEQSMGWYTFNTGLLLDQVLTMFRVIALDSRGIGGVSVGFNLEVVCNPIPPVVTVVATGGNLEVRL